MRIQSNRMVLLYPVRNALLDIKDLTVFTGNPLPHRGEEKSLLMFPVFHPIPFRPIKAEPLLALPYTKQIRLNFRGCFKTEKLSQSPPHNACVFFLR